MKNMVIKKDDTKFTRKAQDNVQNEMKLFFCFPHNIRWCIPYVYMVCDNRKYPYPRHAKQPL